jgi:uncharacterized Fe-S cluster protein YjdI
MKIKKEYTHGDLTVVWQPHLCIHSAICFRSLPQVFKPRERPWIHLSEGDPQHIKDTVLACPSGALSLQHVVQEKEVSVITDSGLPPKVFVAKNGPLRIKEACHVILADGTIVEKPNGVSLCRCGGSSEKPFCDGAHKVNGFIG